MPSLFKNPRRMRSCAVAAIVMGIFAAWMPSLLPQAVFGQRAMVGALVGSFSFVLGISLWVFRAAPSPTDPSNSK